MGTSTTTRRSSCLTTTLPTCRMCSLRGIQLAAGASPESTSESWVSAVAQARILYDIKSSSSLSQPEAEAENPRIRAVVTGCRSFRESRGGGVIDEAFLGCIENPRRTMMIITISARD